MDWGTIGTAVGGAVGAALTVLKVAPRFSSTKATRYELSGELGEMLRGQTELMRRMISSQERMQFTHEEMSKSLAILTALQQNRG